MKTPEEINKFIPSKSPTHKETLAEKSTADLARIIAKRLETLHMGGRLRDKKGTTFEDAGVTYRETLDANGTGIPLSVIDREEITLAARAGIIAAKQEKADFLETWRRASREARAALYRITKCPTFKSRARAEGAGARAHERYLETCEKETPDISEADRLDYNSPDSEQIPFYKAYRNAREALMEYWGNKIAFSPYPRASYDFRKQLELLSRLARDSRDGLFMLEHGRGRDTAPQKRIERLAANIVRGRAIIAMEKPRLAPARREAIGAIAPRAHGTRQADSIFTIGTGGATGGLWKRGKWIPREKPFLTEKDWLARTATKQICRTLPAIAEKLGFIPSGNAPASRAQLQTLAASFAA